MELLKISLKHISIQTFFWFWNVSYIGFTNTEGLMVMIVNIVGDVLV